MSFFVKKQSSTSLDTAKIPRATEGGVFEKSQQKSSRLLLFVFLILQALLVEADSSGNQSQFTVENGLSYMVLRGDSASVRLP